MTKKPLIIEWLSFVSWWPQPESNWRHTELQSVALPTELQGHWLREKDLNLRPSGYEPDELPDCSIPRYVIFTATPLYHIYLTNQAKFMAEEGRFELPHALTSAGFQDQSLQPLGYSSIRKFCFIWWTL